MRCPYCGAKETRVLDSRSIEDGEGIRRRRECEVCRKRFTTFERAERATVFVLKRDGRREPFVRGKVLTGMLRACEGRPVSQETLERIADEIEGYVVELGDDGRLVALQLEELTGGVDDDRRRRRSDWRCFRLRLLGRRARPVRG